MAKYDSAALRDIIRMKYPIKAVPKKVLYIFESQLISVSNINVKVRTTYKVIYPLYPLSPSRSPKIAMGKVTRHASTYTGTDMRFAAVALNPN